MDSQTNAKHIFIVSVVLYQDYRRRYPTFEARECVCGYSNSLKNAEKLMHDEIFRDDTEPVYCFYIREKRLDCNLHHTPGNGRLSERVYDAKGNLLDKRLFSWEEEYEGRDPEDIRFDCGDIVEAYDSKNRSVSLGFIMEQPPTKEEIRKQNAHDSSLKEPPSGEHYHDASDDCYMFMTDDSGNHEHLDALYVFKPHFPIPKPTLERIKRQYRRYLEKYADNFFHKPLTDSERTWLKVHNVDIEQ